MKKSRNKSRPIVNCVDHSSSHFNENLKIRIKIGGSTTVPNKSIDQDQFQSNLADRVLKGYGSKLTAEKHDKVISVPSTQPLSQRPLRQKKQNARYHCINDEVKKVVKMTKVKYKGKSKGTKKNKKENEIPAPEKVKEISVKKKRNSERRKEKSRDAARCRRGKESEIFDELGALLPLESPLIASLDKASVIRVATAFLRTRSLVTWGLDIPLDDLNQLSETSDENPLQGQDILQALDGFLIVLTPEGEVIYTSENISTFLGISQLDVIGHSLLDYTHPCDHDEVRHLATLVATGPNNTFLRFKCTLTPKGRSVNLKSATYKVVQITGQVLDEKGIKCTEVENDLPSRGGNSWIVALGVPVPHPSNIEVPLDKQTFVSKHSLDMKFTYVDENVIDFCGYRPEDLLGRSLYQLNHALDTQLVKEAYKTLRSKGQVETGRYRFLAHGGGYVWVVTQATLISGHRDSKPQYVVCLNFVLSQVEFGDIIFSDCQLRTSETKRNAINNRAPPAKYASSFPHVPCSVPSLILPCLPPSQLPAVPSAPAPSKPSPVAATCSLLRDRTEDMNEGYLTFADNDSHVTILKEEPEDLTHLAPSVGEDCVPLEVPVFFPVFDDLLSPESDCYLTKQPETGVNFSDSVERSIEILLNESPLTSHFQGTENPAKHPRLYESSSKSFYKTTFESSAEGNLHFPADQFSSSSQKVPERGVVSPQNSVVLQVNRFGFDTPEPPFSPLLSQTALPLTPEKQKDVYCSDPKPIPATSKLFASLDEDNSSNSAMDLFHSFDLKLEEDLDLRAPYIPPIDEVLAFDQDELFGMSNNNECHDRRDVSCFGDKHTKDGLSCSAAHQILGSFSSQHSFQHNKHGADTGGNFVDPNQVLPGQFYVKGEDKDNLQELRYLLEAPPPSPVKEPVDPPPPLKNSGSVPSIVFIKTGSKRPSSPSGFTITKRLRPAGFSTSMTLTRGREQPVGHSVTSNGKPELPTPHAPLMQQLLVSKEPIRVRGRVVSSLSSSAQDGRRCKRAASPSDDQPEIHTHSVLRNLLVSGRDERAGYAVMTSTGDDDPKGGEGDKNDSSNPASPLHPINSFPLNKEGKIELTRQQLSDLLDRAGAFRSSFRAHDGGESMPPTPPESFSPISISPRTPATPVADSSLEKPILMLDSSLSSIPSLFDLTSFDCEVNAPAPDPALLQGSELLMALEQTQ